jgi:hypothetical protein
MWLAAARSAIISAASGPPDLIDMNFIQSFVRAPLMIAGMEHARDT